MIVVRESRSRWRIKTLLAAVMALVVMIGSTGITSAYTINLTVTHAKETQKHWCVPASAWMELKQIGASPPSQQALYDTGYAHKRCPGVGIGLDPLAWAWILYANTGAGYFYDDFTYTSTYSGTAAMAAQLVDRGEVAGALVNEGHHAIVFKGVTADCDLRYDSCWQSSPTFSTIYVDDPWYSWSTNTPGKDANGCPGDLGGTFVCGRIGLKPNTAITYATWKAYYFTDFGHQDCPHWDGKWVAVLRKSSGAPTSAMVSGAGKDPAYAPTLDPEPGVTYPEPARKAASVETAADASLASLDAAFTSSSERHKLGERRELTAALDGGHIARIIPVRSLVTTFPDYLLATVVGKHGLRGVAMFTLEDPAHPAFAGMTYSDEALTTYPALDRNDAVRAVKAAGHKVHGSPELVWGWSAESSSPYYPMWQVTTDSGPMFVSPSGAVLSDPGLQAPAR